VFVGGIKIRTIASALDPESQSILLDLQILHIYEHFSSSFISTDILTSKVFENIFLKPKNVLIISQVRT
jgi:hypothetical protein